MTLHKKSLVLLSVLLLSNLLQAAPADRDKPIEIEADEASFSQNNMQTQFSGNVVVTQGSLKIHAQTVHMKRLENGNQTVKATGKPVTFQQNLDEKKADGSPQTIRGEAHSIRFDKNANTVILNGNAKINREGDNVSGNQITYNTATSVYSVTGNKNKRVSVVLQPQPKKK